MSFMNTGMSSFKSAPLTDDDLHRLVPSLFAETAHESRSDKFVYIPTKDMLQKMRAEGFQVYDARQGRSRIPGKAGFTKHMLRFRHANFLRPEQVGDNVFEIIMLNSHDGTSRYFMESGIFRAVCLNGLMVKDAAFPGFSVPHRGDPNEIMGQVIEGAYTVLNERENVMARVEEFQKIDLSIGQQYDFANRVHAVRFEDAEYPPSPDALLQRRRSADRGRSLWATMNVVQENALKGGLSYKRPIKQGERKPRQMTTRELKSVDGRVTVNRAVWGIAEDFATKLIAA